MVGHTPALALRNRETAVPSPAHTQRNDRYPDDGGNRALTKCLGLEVPAMNQHRRAGGTELRSHAVQRGRETAVDRGGNE
ncbi:hypothetical protein SAMN05444422_103101 [Halobiforma haloterrestris]|uniref:Uncharacterized protein n=1 Tax=Natronobacterium haloterrestre TaxID=148448 RepID=A0A1I1F148_NATHA|nr:hypothetical protein SAMN05444422_103101 [Halobiforma haloterrestris]